ncbi:helix-turn-helix transcriptional regulator [Chitinophaga sp. G-6-1-13]|uniref:Helix-turn-helix transcriptional regulator n=1 Tax=Chitinophaga fulva TaxID=2728842 RepID=A0A848GV50_9BACT|nr:AraC family transcriptional regulator [Chitinophaga fulva]NML40593.1 helix-turn-helix transcriptional regulator [Chitinophaga fulva]
MANTFRNNTGDILYVEQNSMRLPEVMQTTERQLRLPFWDIDLQQHYYDGIHVAHCNINVREDLYVTSGPDAPIPGMVFVQQGKIAATGHDSRVTHSFAQGQHNFFRNPYNPQTSVFYQQQNLQLLLIGFAPERFLQLAEHAGPVLYQVADNMVAGKEWEHKENLPVTRQMQCVLHDINTCRFQGTMKDLYLQTKALELLLLRCEQQELKQQMTKTNIKLSETDIRKIHAARECLLTDIHHPPSLGQLARQTGLNEFKLKAGFRKVFNNSVFGYLREHRLELAWQLLKKKELSVTAVAYEAGYTTVQHFSKEFSKHFGVSPSRID